MSCTDYCPEQPSTRDCAGARLTVDPPNLIDVHDVYRLNGGTNQRVFIGNTVGTGSLTVSTPCVSKTYRLEILER